MKDPLTPTGIEPVTFRFVAQHLNHCATASPMWGWWGAETAGLCWKVLTLHWLAVHAVAAGNADIKMVRVNGLKLELRNFGLLVRVTEHKLGKN